MRKVALLLICLLSLAVVANSKPAYAKSFITFVKSLTLKTIAPAHKAEENLDAGADHANAADGAGQADDDIDEKPDDSDDASTQDDEEEPAALTKGWSAPEASSNLLSIADATKSAGVSESSSTSVRVGAPRGDVVNLELKPWKLCKDIKNLGDYITCWAVQVGTSIDEKRVEAFNKIAISPYTKQFIHQRFTYRYLPLNAAKEYLPAFFSLYRAKGLELDWARQALQVMKHCDQGFYLKLYDNEAAHLNFNNKKFFDFNTRFFAMDCRDRTKIDVIIFRGHRTGFWKPRQFNQPNSQLAAQYSRDTFLYLINKHFGAV